MGCLLPSLRELLRSVFYSLDLCSFFFFNNFIYLFLAVLGLRHLLGFFSSCGNGGYSLVAVLRLLLLWSTGSWVQVLSRCGSRALGHNSVVHGFSCSEACGTIPDRIKPVTPLTSGFFTTEPQEKPYIILNLSFPWT